MYSSFKKQQLITESWRRFLNEDKASLGDPIDLIDNFSATRQIRYKKGGYDSEFYKIEDVKSLYNKLNIIFQNRDLFEKYFAPGPYQTIERLQKAFIEKLEKDVGGIANTVDEENVNYNPFTELRRFLVELRKNKAKLEVPEDDETDYGTEESEEYSGTLDVTAEEPMFESRRKVVRKR